MNQKTNPIADEDSEEVVKVLNISSKKTLIAVLENVMNFGQLLVKGCKCHPNPAIVETLDQLLRAYDQLKTCRRTDPSICLKFILRLIVSLFQISIRKPLNTNHSRVSAKKWPKRWS